jgi:hypothetical protein
MMFLVFEACYSELTNHENIFFMLQRHILYGYVRYFNSN